MLFSSCSFCYFLINFLTNKIEGTIVRNTLISQFAECTADLSSAFIYMFLGPKLGLFSMYTLSAAGSALLIAFFHNDNLIPYFIIMAKFGISGCFNMVFVLSV